MSDHYRVIDVHKSAKALEVGRQLNVLAGDGYSWVGTIPLGDSTLVLMVKPDAASDEAAIVPRDTAATTSPAHET